MIYGKSVVELIIAAFICICVFFLAQYLISLLFGLVGFSIPAHIVNVLSLLIAIGGFYGIGWRRGG